MEGITPGSITADGNVAAGECGEDGTARTDLYISNTAECPANQLMQPQAIIRSLDTISSSDEVEEVYLRNIIIISGQLAPTEVSALLGVTEVPETRIALLGGNILQLRIDIREGIAVVPQLSEAQMEHLLNGIEGKLVIDCRALVGIRSLSIPSALLWAILEKAEVEILTASGTISVTEASDEEFTIVNF